MCFKLLHCIASTTISPMKNPYRAGLFETMDGPTTCRVNPGGPSPGPRPEKPQAPTAGRRNWTNLDISSLGLACIAGHTYLRGGIPFVLNMIATEPDARVGMGLDCRCDGIRVSAI